MKKINILILSLFMMSFIMNDNNKSLHIPEYLSGNFIDDYGIIYTITDSVWIQHPTTKLHILKWDLDKQYLIAVNDKDNPSEAGLYTRIDFMKFTNMEPFTWGFCLTAYDAKNEMTAEATKSADKENPKKGCSGFPFSRMKRTE